MTHGPTRPLFLDPAMNRCAVCSEQFRVRCGGRRRSSGVEADVVVWSGENCTWKSSTFCRLPLLVCFTISLSVCLPILAPCLFHGLDPFSPPSFCDDQVLDMVTDRMSTSGLLVLLADAYSTPSDKSLCLLLIALDIISHWYAMYASLKQQQHSHKSLSATKPWYQRVEWIIQSIA